MKKYYILLLLLFGLTLTSCKNTIPTKENEIEGHISFIGEKKETLDLDFFTSIDSNYNKGDELPKVTKNVFNLENIMQDLDNVSIDKTLFHIWSVKKSNSYGTTSKDGINTIRVWGMSWEPSFTYVGNDDFRNFVLSNPTRYYSNEFLSNIKQLEEGTKTKEEILSTYGLYYVSSISRYQSAKATITIGDINNRNNPKEIELLQSYYENGDKYLSLESYSEVMKLIPLYDISIHLETSGVAYSFEDYMNEIDTSNVYGELSNEVRDASKIFLPAEYQVAADILELHTYF